MKQPTVSVILPSFDRLGYLRQAVDSVLEQTFADWELIVADDGSGPETLAYLQALETHPKVRILRLSHTGNPGAVRNAALRKARGEYVAFLDSDDSWMPTKLEVQTAALAASTRQWGYTEHLRIDHDGKSINSQRNPDRVLYRGRVVEPLLRLRAGIPMPTVMVRRRLLESAGGFDEQQELHEDHELWLRLALLSEVDAIGEPLACVRRHGEHFSSGGIRNFEARRRVFDKMDVLVTHRQERRVLRMERSRNDARLAVAYAAAGNRSAVWQTLTGTWRRSWRSVGWYGGGARAIVRVFAPHWLVLLLRHFRASMRRAALLQ
jgi:glycosyltransferase involved in cell wall biosynthesis